MAQIFHRSTNTISRVSIYGAALMAVAAAGVTWQVYRSPWMTREDLVIDQPVEFSHEHHVRGLGIDCRYCHTSVETSSFAGIPPIHTCMSCHSQVWTEAPILEPIREAWRTGVPVRWARVHDLPEFVFFNHAMHVQNGIGCSSCHGRVDRMPLVWQTNTLHMRWCLDCHEAPERHLRPKELVYQMDWEPPPDQEAAGRALAEAYGIDSHRLRDCMTCHR